MLSQLNSLRLSLLWQSAKWSCGQLVEATVQKLKGPEQPSAAESLILQKSQIDSFPEEYRLLKAGKPVQLTSRLLTLAPEFD